MTRTLTLSALLVPATALAQDVVEQDIRGLKPALEVPHHLPVWPWLLAAAVLLVVAVLAWRWWHRAVPVDPVAQLTEALASAADVALDVPAYVDLASSAVRVFVQQTSDIDAPSLTTDELMAALGPRLPGDLARRVAETLHTWDAIRFAGDRPDQAPSPNWIDELVTTLTEPGVPAEPDTETQAAK